MANQIRIASSLTPVQDVEETSGGNTYNVNQIDKNVLRSFGGKYDTLTVYTDNDIARWSNAVISTTSYDGLNDSGWTEESDVTDGTLPTTVFAVAIEYIAELGTVGTVELAITYSGGTPATHRIEMVSLDLGEGIAIPISAGTPIANIEIKAGAYSNGVNEASVNVLVLGT